MSAVIKRIDCTALNVLMLLLAVSTLSALKHNAGNLFSVRITHNEPDIDNKAAFICLFAAVYFCKSHEN